MVRHFSFSGGYYVVMAQRLDGGVSFAAVIETKTPGSEVVWIRREDNLNTRHVYGHTEQVQIFPDRQADTAGDYHTEQPSPAAPGLADNPG